MKTKKLLLVIYKEVNQTLCRKTGKRLKCIYEISKLYLQVLLQRKLSCAAQDFYRTKQCNMKVSGRLFEES